MTPILVPSGTVESVLITHPGVSTSEPVDELVCYVGLGIEGDRHAGRHMVDAREDVARTIGLPKGVEIANLRQFSAVSRHELDEISKRMGLSTPIMAGLLGENLVISGIHNFSNLPVGTQLVFQRADKQGLYRSTILYVTAENNPCKVPAENILAWVNEHKYRVDKSGQQFAKAAKGSRGVVGLVKASGKIGVGDRVFAMMPPLYEAPELE